MKRLCLILILLMLGLPLLAHHQRSQHASRSGKGWPMTPFELQDQRGDALTQARLQGRWTFLLLGDTECRAPCTDALSALAGLRQRIARTEVLKTTQVLFVSLEPQRDKAEQLRSYLAPFDASFIGASGAAPVLQQLVDDLVLDPVAEQGRQNHRGALLLIAPDLSVRVEYLPPYDVKLLTADYLITRSRR